MAHLTWISLRRVSPNTQMRSPGGMCSARCFPDRRFLRCKACYRNGLVLQTSRPRHPFTLTCQVNVLCEALADQYAAGKSSNLYLGFRCFATDVLMLFCYNKSLEATRAPDFHADVVVASESMLPYLSLCKYSSFLVMLVHYFPAWLAKKSGSPVLAALFHVREVRLLPSQYAARGGESFHRSPVALICFYFCIHTASDRTDRRHPAGPYGTNAYPPSNHLSRPPLARGQQGSSTAVTSESLGRGWHSSRRWSRFHGSYAHGHDALCATKPADSPTS